MLTLMVSAYIDVYAFQVDGIRYSVVSKDDHTIKVTDAPSGYQGEIQIPSVVSFDNQNWIVIEIGRKAFSNCSRLTDIKIPNSVTCIGYEAFLGCDSLASVDIPESVTEIGGAAFCDCQSLTKISLGNSVTEIRNSMFKGCISLTSITIPNSVRDIDEEAFYGCSSLTNITIPNSVRYIDEEAFYGCSSLTNVTIGNSVIQIGRKAFGSCKSLTGISLGNSVIVIKEYAFSGCSSLTDITIPNSVSRIEYCAFIDCNSLEKITISSSNTTICYAFFPESLKEIYCMSVFPPIANDGGWNDQYYQELYKIRLENMTLYAPKGFLANYIERNPWQKFPNIVGIDYVPLEAIALDNSEIMLKDGKNKRLSLIFTPDNATDKTIEWSSSNEEVATVNSAGFVYGEKSGDAIITANCGNITAECKVTVRVKDTPVNSISLNKMEAKVGISQILQLTATVNPYNATDKTVTWSSSDEAVATVSETGLVTPTALGTTIITAKCDKLITRCLVIVVESTVPAESISMNKSEAKVDIRETLQLTATVKPDEATDKTVTWSSSDEAVATVSETGLVTAKAVGTATITAKCCELTATCAITVEDSSAIDEVFTDPDERVDVYSILGTRVRMGVRRDDITGLPAGVYILRTTSGKTMKVVII